MMDRATRQRIVAPLLAAAVAFASIGAPASVAGDVNGDRAVNVRDLQSLMVALVELEGGLPRADVNGDGCLDVLDFQALLDHTGSEPATPPSSPMWECGSVPLAIAPGAQVGVATPVFAQAVLPAAAYKPRVAAACAHFGVGRGDSARTDRYLFQLTPNAPPA